MLTAPSSRHARRAFSSVRIRVIVAFCALATMCSAVLIFESRAAVAGDPIQIARFSEENLPAKICRVSSRLRRQALQRIGRWFPRPRPLQSRLRPARRLRRPGCEVLLCRPRPMPRNSSPRQFRRPLTSLRSKSARWRRKTQISDSIPGRSDPEHQRHPARSRGVASHDRSGSR